jgi:hypothetical protein
MQFTCNIIEGEYLHITYYGCIEHTIDLVIEDIGKLKWVNIIVKEAKTNIKISLYKIQELFRG